MFKTLKRRFTRRIDVPPPWAPTAIAGCTLWLKADALSLSNNDPVAEFTDYSGNGNHPAQTNASLKPLYKTNVVNGKAGVYFDATDDTMSGPSILAHYAFIVCNYTPNNDTFQTYAGAFTLMDVDPYFTGDSGNSNWSQGASSTSYVNTVQTFNLGGNLNTFKLSEMKVERSDGASTGTIKMGVDRGYEGLGRYWGGHIAEVICYDSVISTEDIALVRDYLNTKYNLY